MLTGQKRLRAHFNKVSAAIMSDNTEVRNQSRI